MIHYVNQKEAENWKKTLDTLAVRYARGGSWEPLVNNTQTFAEIIYSTAPDFRKGSLGTSKSDKKHDRHQSSNSDYSHSHSKSHTRKKDNRSSDHRSRSLPSLLDGKKNRIIGEEKKNEMTLPIVIDNSVVGWLAVSKKTKYIDHTNVSFVNNLNVALSAIVLVIIFCSFFIALPLSRHIVTPIREIASAANSLTKGNYDFKSNFRRKDEIGSLANDFETLAATLKSNELSRIRWVASISHELRTPLSIVLSEIDAILDGVRSLKIENLHSVKYEIEHLAYLVNDLYELSNAEIGALRYEREEMDIRTSVSQAAQRFEELLANKGIEFTVNLPKFPILVMADPQRLDQLLNNLLVNELKYSDSNGQVSLSLREERDHAVLAIEDSGPGVNESNFERLFDYLYRMEDSRNRRTGGMGLGLAICKNIVNAHSGSIHAEKSSLGGLKIVTKIPKI